MQRNFISQNMHKILSSNENPLFSMSTASSPINLIGNDKLRGKTHYQNRRKKYNNIHTALDVHNNPISQQEHFSTVDKDLTQLKDYYLKTEESSKRRYDD